MIKFKLSKYNKEVLIQKLQNLDTRTLYEVLVREFKSSRSQDQNEYYWEMITEMANYFGYDKDTMHSLMQYEFLTTWKEVQDKKIPVITSTTKLNVKQFNEYLENIKRWAAEYGFVWND